MKLNMKSKWIFETEYYTWIKRTFAQCSCLIQTKFQAHGEESSPYVWVAFNIKPLESIIEIRFYSASPISFVRMRFNLIPPEWMLNYYWRKMECWEIIATGRVEKFWCDKILKFWFVTREEFLSLLFSVLFQK